jgi:hypothetical protein
MLRAHNAIIWKLLALLIRSGAVNLVGSAQTIPWGELIGSETDGVRGRPTTGRSGTPNRCLLGNAQRVSILASPRTILDETIRELMN